MKDKASDAKDFVDRHGFDVSYCFLVDMRIPSGKNRFFVYNLLKDSLEATGLVTHGKGSENESGDLVFSNMPNSNCTSLGKYKIGNSYNGNFGLSYKLMGLDKTNSRALDRAVVLHSYMGVPNSEVYPSSITLSEGCPAVSPAFFAQLKGYMDESQEPILLWIYY
ncbi:MAG: murein L,D-transpeptidase catalytic domain family protein [Ferruginibacter sp.]|nr:murein L,D-transpeptidase catalytic domain family protein [Ferruginibacter sp.]